MDIGRAKKGAKGFFLWSLLALLSIGIATSTSWAKPLVTGTRSMVVSNHYLASQAGLKVLEKGGTAADAAVATAAVLGVVEPWFSNILGGGTWAIYYDKKSGRVRALDGVGYAPTHATPEFFRDLDIAPFGMHMSILPGAWDGWILLLKEHGRLSLKEILEPAIDMAENGIVVHPSFAFWSKRLKDNIALMPDTAAVYLKDGKPYKAGEIIRQTDLANTYKKLVDVEQQNLGNGRRAALQAASDYFYRGPLAEKIVAFSKKHGGLFELKDFHNFRAELPEPIKISYRGYDVYQCPPNSQGITQLLALNILEGYDLKKMKRNDPATIHLVAESLKLAFADRFHYVGDPAFVKVPVEKLLSKEHAANQRKRLSMDKVMNWPIPGGIMPSDTGTTTFHVVDAEGSAIAVTTSQGANFLVIPGTGINMNNRMRMFEIEEGNANLVMPGKKVRHTSNPSMAFKDGELFMSFGASGVDTQPQNQLWEFLSVVEWGLNPQEAVAAGRIVVQSFPPSSRPYKVANALALERGKFSPEVINALKAKGHKVTHRAIWGTANMLVRDPKTGVLTGGADPHSAAGIATR